MKTCFKCGAEKPLSEFYVHKQMTDGRLNKCKECTKKDSRENRRNNVEYYREYDRKRGNRQSKEYRDGYKARKQKAYWARTAVGNALRDGKLIKGLCEVCGDSNVHGHHDDYDRPLDVRWLCPAHHSQWHKENGEGRNAG